jgi:long-chain-fatty-acid--[acyl-carrier-protein] ligase
MGKSNIKITLKDSDFGTSTLPLQKIRVQGNTTIHDLFVKTFTSYKNEIFVWDNMLGSTSRKDFYLKTMVVSEIIKREVPGQYVGIMLPALQSTSLLVAATYMSGKIPVMLNWTVGPQILDHCVATTKLTHIITAGAFFDKVRDKLSDDVKSKCIMFEKKVREASLSIKLKGLLRSKTKAQFSVQPSDIAVILFTSGSESLPKAVPLTHKNILRDMEGSFNHLDINNTTVFLSFLPPFHSFGFTVLTVTPLVTGMKVVYTPDPTATRDIVEIVKHTGADTMLATPTFLKMILAVATKEDLKSIKLVVTGAESLQPSIIDEFKKKTQADAQIIEGYGITECSPALSLNPIGKQKLKSVGTFISTVEYLIVDLQKSEALEQGKEGMILVRGDNIFGGYLNKDVASPFVTVNGKEYYKTGDLGYVDSDGYLFITGRLKRFIKIAGEMISLPAIKQRLLEKFGSNDEVVLAVEGSDSVEPPQIVLFTKVELDITEVNKYLRSTGFSNLIKIHTICTLEEIPVLGTGKTDYKVLKAMIR